jgi:uncharacterized RDD family membrane protein YckC
LQGTGIRCGIPTADIPVAHEEGACSDLPGQTTGSTGAPPGQPPEYQQQPVAHTGKGPSGPRAGFWRRFGAVIVDGLVLLVPSAIVTVLVDSTGAANAITTLIGLVYYVALEGGPRGQTVGKMALGIRVYDFRGGGGPIGYGRALVRNLVKYVSGIVVLLGYLWMLWDKEKQTWHDHAAGSVVVPTDAYPV